MAKILIIEDDKNIASLEKDYLEMNGYETKIIADGLEGVKEARTKIYDLIIIDVMLPTINGFDICAMIRDELSIPMIIVSARNDDIDKIKGLGLGADDYITKPFSPSELIARVKNQLARYERFLKTNEDGVTLEYHNIVLNKEARKVIIGGKEVAFTATEFDMLQFFMKNPDIVHSKTILFDRIWGEDEYGDIATVAVYIQKIRKKIEKNPSTPKIIETVWGAGYRFNKF
ncbi:DNA-binding response regulator [Petrocella atlantisensis]|uniref:Stage 0 sporulation protein A homolog n=1 Tax=Petrocella atlantisensis TaxID=2173034 RepID=A0A3P7RZG4_9FIRM|nr:response regulator transcription factor [Petrocella atlantisensis]VDN48066.1 DNA-binding response regulator [Petrocella atlantisensis]